MAETRGPYPPGYRPRTRPGGEGLPAARHRERDKQGVALTKAIETAGHLDTLAESF